MYRRRSPALTLGFAALCGAPLTVASPERPPPDAGEVPPILSPKERERELAKLFRIVETSRAPVKSVELRLQLNGQPQIGRSSAGVVVVEFSDFQCPFCKRHAEQTMPLLVPELVETGAVRYVYFDYPVESAHPFARKAAEAARCAAEQGRYHAMREHLFGNAKALQPVLLREHAKAVGLDETDFADCLASERVAASVSSDLAEAIELGVRGTPAFFLGFPVGDGDEIDVRRRIDGAEPYPVFEEVVKELLAESQ